MTTAEPLDLPKPLTDDEMTVLHAFMSEWAIYSDRRGYVSGRVERLLAEVKRLREREEKIRLLLPDRPGLDHLVTQFVNPAMLRDILDSSA